jgi:hypothetical protein
MGVAASRLKLKRKSGIQGWFAMTHRLFIVPLLSVIGAVSDFEKALLLPVAGVDNLTSDLT